MKDTVQGERKDKMRYVKLEAIIVGERFREDLGSIDELVESIQTKGIIQPLTVDSDMNLLAGGRRYAASTKAGLHTVPVIIREVSDEIDAREIELIENIHRKDFTWAERAALVARIDALYKEKNQDWSGRKTAQLIDRSVAGVQRDLQLANAIKVLPELGNIKTADEALKTLKKLEGDAIVQELRRRQDSGVAAEGEQALPKGIKDCLKLADANYHIGDVFAGMEGLRDNGNIQLIECDPPYGIDLNEQKASRESVTSTVTGYEEVDRKDYPDFLSRLTSELYRVANKDCWLIFWYGPTWHQTVLESLRSAGWMVDEIPAIWVKKQGQTLQPEKYFARCYEPFFLCRKGNPVMVERGRSNVFEFAGVAGQKKYHPTERPVKLIEEIFNTLAVGRTVTFIPFLGSGATLRACYNLGFQGFGYDLDGKYKDKFMLAVEEDSRENLSKS